MARTAAALGDPLRVVLTSAASRTALIPTLQQLKDCELVYYVSSESMFDLAFVAPGDRVPTP